MAQTHKERDLEILNHKIDTETETIANFVKYGISEVKRDKLIVMRDAHIVKRDEVMASPDY